MGVFSCVFAITYYFSLCITYCSIVITIHQLKESISYVSFFKFKFW